MKIVLHKEYSKWFINFPFTISDWLCQTCRRRIPRSEVTRILDEATEAMEANGENGDEDEGTKWPTLDTNRSVQFHIFNNHKLGHFARLLE
jgi:hypothetical protein